MYSIKYTVRDLRLFGYGLAGFLLLLFLLLAVLGGLDPLHFLMPIAIALVALLVPRLLVPVFLVVMTVTRALGYLNIRILLSVFFLLVLTPVSWVRRLLGKRFYPVGSDPAKSSYWEAARQASTDFTRQF